MTQHHGSGLAAERRGRWLWARGEMAKTQGAAGGVSLHVVRSHPRRGQGRQRTVNSDHIS
jgi:hypothetical protein